MDTQFRNRLILAFYIPSILIAIAYAILTPVLPVFASELTNVYGLIGVILAAQATGRVLGDLPTSWFLRRLGVKNTMILSLLIVIVPVLLIYWVRSIPVIILLLVISGFGHALYNISRHAYISVAIPLHIRGRSIGLLGGVFRIGNFVGPLIGGWVGATFGLEAGFLAFGVFALLTLLFVWAFMWQVQADETDDQHAGTSQMLAWRTMLRERRDVLASAGAAQILAQLTREGWKILIPLYGADALGLDVQTIGLIVGAGAALDMLFFYASGVIMDRFGRKWAIVPSFVMQGVGVGMMLLADDALALGAVAAFIGFANGISSGTMMTLGADLAPPAMRSEFLSVWRLIGDLGFVGGSLVVGSVAQLLMIQTSVLAITGAGFGAALLFAVFVPETLKKRKHTPPATGD